MLEILDPIVDIIPINKIKLGKKPFFGILSLIVGLLLAFGAGLRVLQPLGTADHDFWDGIVTGLIVSAGTEGFNSIMKFLGYSKEKQKADAAEEQKNV